MSLSRFLNEFFMCEKVGWNYFTSLIIYVTKIYLVKLKHSFYCFKLLGSFKEKNI